MNAAYNCIDRHLATRGDKVIDFTKQKYREGANGAISRKRVI